MFKKSLILTLFILALSCPAFANGWDGVTYQLEGKSVAFMIKGDMVFIYTESGEKLDDVAEVEDDFDMYKINLESGNFVMMDKSCKTGKFAYDNHAYKFHVQH